MLLHCGKIIWFKYNFQEFVQSSVPSFLLLQLENVCGKFQFYVESISENLITHHTLVCVITKFGIRVGFRLNHTQIQGYYSTTQPWVRVIIEFALYWIMLDYLGTTQLPLPCFRVTVKFGVRVEFRLDHTRPL